MQRLRYLEGKTLTPGHAPFVTYATYPVENGSADLWIYEIFPGVELMVTDFASETCFQSGVEQDVIGINHCEKGRFECVFDRQNYVYMGEGDVAINSMLHPPIGASFPLGYYFGSTVILYPDICNHVPELASFGINTEMISEKYSLQEQCRVFRRNEAVEHVYRELYAHLAQPDLAYLKLKVLELLYHFQAKETAFEENREYLSKALTEKIKHVKEHMIENLQQRISLRELAEEHNISLTQLKTGFKQIYGETPYAYLKSYKMHTAAQMLLKTEQKVLDIATGLGYQNPSKFTEAFTSVMGRSPLEYRKQKNILPASDA